MADLTLLDHLIQNPPSNPPSEAIVDEHFDQIVNFIEQEKIKEAAKLIEKVFAKQVPDIRLIVYYIYAHFTDNGIKSFATTFPLIKSLVIDHEATLTPKNRTDKHIQNSLNWFFSHLLQRFKYYEKLHASGKEHPIWKKSISGISIEDIENLTETAKDFNHFFLERWPLSPTKDRVLHLVKKIEEIGEMLDFGKVAAAPPLDEIIEVEEAEIEEVIEEPVEEEVLREEPVFDFFEEETEPVCEPEISQEVETPVFEEPMPVERPVETIELPAENSPSFEEEKETMSQSLQSFIKSLDQLSYKLKVFEELIEKNNYLKAAVVAKDIDHLIENFDPLSYFPKLFAKYFSLFAKHVTALSEQYDKKDSLQVKALEKLYRTDLELFMDW
ncbi:MAG: hypothetical protein LW832_07265 [Parachlamydia sp.]|nr:hypothetical protein [Parachlamydia sp.]